MVIARAKVLGKVVNLQQSPIAFCSQAGHRQRCGEIFSQVMDRWTKGEYEAEGVPRWEEFTKRVDLGIEKIKTRHGAKKRLAVFTSGGPISVAVKSALGLSDRMTLEISWQLMNASITRLKYNSKGIMLAGFNEVMHLELERDERLLTYR